MNYIIAPHLYLGSSFIDILDCMENDIEQIGLQVSVFRLPVLPNKLNEYLDDQNFLPRQLQALEFLQKIVYADRVLFLDFFNPGLDILKYHFEIEGKFVRLGSLLHGSYFLPGDIYQMKWLRLYEAAWWHSYDKIYAPLGFPIEKLPPSLQSKVTQTAWGIKRIAFPETISSKSYDVVFPHRLNDDKGVADFVAIVKQLSDVSFLVTCPQSKEAIQKNIYHGLLSQHANVHFRYQEEEPQHLQSLRGCKIVLSCAHQENFGFAVLKAVQCGAIPVLPNRLCYPQMYDAAFLYNNLDEAFDLIRSFKEKKSDKLPLLKEQTHGFAALLNDFFRAE